MAQFPFTLRLRACGIYLFAIVIGYLAAAYLGTFFAVFATMFILLPLISLLLLLIASAGLRYSQHFSNEQPVKGQELQYRCIIENGSALPLPRVRALFRDSSHGRGRPRQQERGRRGLPEPAHLPPRPPVRRAGADGATALPRHLHRGSGPHRAG